MPVQTNRVGGVGIRWLKATDPKTASESIKPREFGARSEGAARQQRILNSLSTWKQIGGPSPSNAQVAWLAGHSPSSTSYTNPRSALKTAGLFVYSLPPRTALGPRGGSP